MHQKELRQEIKKLAQDQRLSLVQEIWDSIAQENDHLPLPDWQKEELEARCQQYRDGKLEMYNWKEVLDILPSLK
jgi:putative addiction module component (TIGR02574 family)